MTEGGIAKKLLLFALPLMAENMFQLLYNTMDTMIVGRCIGNDALSAVGATTTLVFAFTSIFIGLGAGGTVVVAQRFGARQWDEMREAIQNVFALSIICGIIMLILGQLSMVAALRWVNVPENIFEPALQYLCAYFWGIPATAIFNVGSGILRAMGNSRYPVYILVLSSVLNIIMDLLFILVFRWGIAGAAWATVVSQYLSVTAVLLVFARTKEEYHFSLKELCLKRQTLKPIVRVSLPQAVERFVTSGSNVIVQSYINHFGAAFIGGYTIHSRIDLFFFMLTSSLGTATLTFAGQNVGAMKYERLKKGPQIAFMLAAALVCAGFLLVIPLRYQIAKLFSDDQQIIEYAAQLMSYLLPLYLLAAFYNPYCSAIKGTGDVFPVALIMLNGFVISRQIYLLIVTRYIANTPFWVMSSLPFGWFVCAAGTAAYYFSGRWKRGLVLQKNDAQKKVGGNDVL